MINGRNFFDQLIKNDLKTYNNIKQIATGQGDDYPTGCLFELFGLLVYSYFKKYYKLVAIDLSEQQKLDADPKVLQQINFIGNLSRAQGAKMFFIIVEAKETILGYPKGTVKVYGFIHFNIIQNDSI